VLAGASLASLTKAPLDAGPSANLTTGRMLRNIAKGHSSTDFALALQIKDTDQALALGASHGVAMPMVTAARTSLQVGVNPRGPQTRLEGPHRGDAARPTPSGFEVREVVRLLQEGVATINRVVSEAGGARAVIRIGVNPNHLATIKQ
jgi:hypothetical protein